MLDLSNLQNTTRPRKKVQRVGRGVGSKRGKTSCRGGKGDSARAGYRKRFGYEGGQVPLYRKLPVRGFTRGRFAKPMVALTLARLEQYFSDGEVINRETLSQKGLIPRKVPGGIKILATGDLTKKVTIEAEVFTAGTIAKLEERKISYQIVKK